MRPHDAQQKSGDYFVLHLIAAISGRQSGRWVLCSQSAPTIGSWGRHERQGQVWPQRDEPWHFTSALARGHHRSHMIFEGEDLAQNGRPHAIVHAYTVVAVHECTVVETDLARGIPGVRLHALMAISGGITSLRRTRSQRREQSQTLGFRRTEGHHRRSRRPAARRHH